MKFSEIPQRLNQLLMPPDPIIINHVISVEGSDQKKTSCYDIDVEVDDTLKQQQNNFLLCTRSQQEIAALDNKVPRRRFKFQSSDALEKKKAFVFLTC